MVFSLRWWYYYVMDSNDRNVMKLNDRISAGGLASFRGNKLQAELIILHMLEIADKDDIGMHVFDDIEEFGSSEIRLYQVKTIKESENHITYSSIKNQLDDAWNKDLNRGKILQGKKIKHFLYINFNIIKLKLPSGYEEWDISNKKEKDLFIKKMKNDINIPENFEIIIFEGFSVKSKTKEIIKVVVKELKIDRSQVSLYVDAIIARVGKYLWKIITNMEENLNIVIADLADYIEWLKDIGTAKLRKTNLVDFLLDGMILTDVQQDALDYFMDENPVSYLGYIKTKDDSFLKNLQEDYAQAIKGIKWK